VTESRPPDASPDEDDVFPAAFGRAIKVIRTGLGMDRKRLAAASRLSYSYLAEIENGRKPASASALHAIARGLGLSPSMLLAAAEEWAERMREGEPPSAMEEPSASSPWARTSPELPGALARDDQGARARQERWFGGPAGLGSPASRSASEQLRLKRELLMIHKLFRSLSPDDRRLVMELARRLARE
jgi:transcriptional regulator with XRE-family HTH domain